MKQRLNQTIIVSFIIVQLAAFTLVFILLYIAWLFLRRPRATPYVTRIPTELLTFSSPSALAYFHEPAPSTLFHEEEQWLPYTTEHEINADSIQSNHEYAIPKPPDTIRILSLGDSVTYGAYVNTYDTYSYQLEQLLNASSICGNEMKFEVLNLGFPGYDIAYSLQRAVTRGMKYEPDLILLMANEWNVIINELRIPIQQEFVDRGIPLYDPHRQENTAVIMTNKHIDETYGREYVLEYQKKLLETFLETYTTPLVIMSYWLQNDQKELISSTVSGYDHALFWNTLTDITNYPDLQVPDHHPNAAGHKQLAEDMFRKMETFTAFCP